MLFLVEGSLGTAGGLTGIYWGLLWYYLIGSVMLCLKERLMLSITEILH